MDDRLQSIVASLEPDLIARRRDLHRHAELGWCEFRTASLVARRLADLGLEVAAGPDAVADEARMAVPAPEVLDARWERARAQEGADGEYMEAVRGGFTGVVGTLSNGPGPTVGLRFDMDALPIPESRDPSHRPAREGFASINPEAGHSCGHDGHTAVGLAIAEVLTAVHDELRGTVKLVFQPAEEGVCGAKSMVEAGVVDDVDVMLGHHVYSGWARGEIATGLGGHAATDKFDVVFTGEASHAGGSPNTGRNALQAAATAVLNLYAIPRHAKGFTRVNVGRMEAGVGRNVISPNATLVVETRGATNEQSTYMYESAVRVIEAAAAMYACDVSVTAMGSAPSADSDPALAVRVARVAEAIGGFTIVEPQATGGAEDFTYMMRRVQSRGGLAARIGIGSDVQGIHFGDTEGRRLALRAHTPEFDIDEGALGDAVTLLTAVVLDVMREA